MCIVGFIVPAADKRTLAGEHKVQALLYIRPRSSGWSHTTLPQCATTEQQTAVVPSLLLVVVGVGLQVAHAAAAAGDVCADTAVSWRWFLVLMQLRRRCSW
jgi:hypothetical protein